MIRALGFAILLLTLAAGLAACGSNGDAQEATPTPAPQPTADPSLPAGAIPVVNRDMGGSGEYRFAPSRLEFEAGEEVTLALISETEFHTFTVDELDISVEMNAGETVIFTFTFDEPGEYELICIPHQALGMVGEIVVR